jgi:hypothetical protein
VHYSINSKNKGGKIIIIKIQSKELMRTTKLLLVAVGCLAAVVSSGEVESLIRDNNEHRLL